LHFLTFQFSNWRKYAAAFAAAGYFTRFGLSLSSGDISSLGRAEFNEEASALRQQHLGFSQFELAGDWPEGKLAEAASLSVRHEDYSTGIAADENEWLSALDAREA
jgi:hypothetical protein